MNELTEMKETYALIARAADRLAAPTIRHEAFGELVVRYQDLAWGCAWAVLRDDALAEEAAQEAFITAWRRLDQLREPEAFPGWLRRLVLTACNRMTRGRRLMFVPLEIVEALPATDDTPHVHAERRERAEKVRAAIRALPEHERLVTTLFYLGEYSQAEISAFLEVPTTTVVKRLYAARQRMKEMMIEMFSDDLKTRRPSRNDAFADAVSARLRPFAAAEWGLVSAFVYGLEPDFRQDEETWLQNRQQFDESRYRRRQYIAEQAGTQQMVGYGAIEQTIFLPRYRLFLAAEPEALRAGVGDVLLDQLLEDLRAAGAIKVWHRNYAQRTEVLDFLAARGFVETARVWDLRLEVAQVDTTPFLPLLERLASRGITITTVAAERERDADCLHKLHAFLNEVKADDPQRQLFTPAPLEAVVRWFERRDVLPDACFIAKCGEEYVGFTDLNHLEPIPRGIMHGFTGVARAHRRQGVATALKIRAIEYAHAHGYQIIRAFNPPAHAGALALNEKLGFQRRYCYVTVEKFIREPAAVDTRCYDDYVGRYVPDEALLAKYGVPAGFTMTIRQVAGRLFSEARDMQDELFPASETDFFTDHHYGQASFVREEGRGVTHLLYREGEMTLRADKINE
ncbi:MAG: GNAT family N-acetyltransferase [Blastocatellia bacterium]